MIWSIFEVACILYGLFTALTFVKYVGCFQDIVYQELAHLHTHCRNKSLQFNHLTILHHLKLKKKKKWLIWFYATLLWFDSFGPLRINTCMKVQCDMILISKVPFCVFCWLNVVNCK